MKFSLTTILSLSMFCAVAQQSGGNNHVIEKKFIKNNVQHMAWYMVRDTSRIEIGSTTIQTIVEKGMVTVITTVAMKQQTAKWIDSTIARASDLSPVYHASYNGQRDMALHFSKVVTGYYTDKTSGKHTLINDTTSQSYYDSNIYPPMITWLPLREGYTNTIPVYDYKNEQQSGVVSVTIHQVKKGELQTSFAGKRPVWIVTVSDQLAGAANGFSNYFIDREDRRLWKQEITVGGRTMEIIAVQK